MRTPPKCRDAAVVSVCSASGNSERTADRGPAQDQSAPHLENLEAPPRAVRRKSPFPPPESQRYLYSIVLEDLWTGRTAELAVPRADFRNAEDANYAAEVVLEILLEQEGAA
jgi:hypothetical protein